MKTTIDVMTRLRQCMDDVLRDPQNITRKLMDEMTSLINDAIVSEEAADMLAAAAQDEWHRGRAAGIEECERVNAELKKLGAE